MKILEEAKTITECENCGSKLEVSISDTREGWLGARYFTCPVCGFDDNLAEEFPDVILTSETIKFPQHFAHTYSGNGSRCVHIGKEETSETALKIKENLINAKEDVMFTMLGDLFIIVRRIGDKFMAYETHDFYEGEIPFLNAAVIMKDGELQNSNSVSVNDLIRESADYFKANPKVWTWQLDTKEKLFFAVNMAGDETLFFYTSEDVKVYEI